MNTKERFLSNIRKAECKVAVLLLAALCVTVPANAANDNGCGVDGNDYINPELALCSTHVYNIGLTENSDNEANKQIMRDVVALKSTVMMQQMYKQYEYLDATLKRLKTQLEREILTAKLEAAGASSSSSSSGSNSASYTDRNIYLAGTSNCNNESTISGVFTCLRNNYNLIYNMSSSGTNLSTELRKQLANDCEVVRQNASGAGLDSNSLTAVTNGSTKIDCTNFANIKGRTEFQKCLDALNVQIRNATSNLTQRTQQQNNQQVRQ